MESAKLILKIKELEKKYTELGLTIDKLLTKYTKITAKFKPGQIVYFKEKYGTKWKRGKIRTYMLGNIDAEIEYTLEVLNKDNTPSRKEFSYHYATEGNIKQIEST